MAMKPEKYFTVNIQKKKMRKPLVRMGDASNPSNPSFAVSGFDTELWEKINAVIRWL